MSDDDLRVRTLLRAFADDEFARWLLPDQEHRHRVYREWFGMVLQRAEQHGEVIAGADGLAVQIWLSGRDGPPEMLDEAGGRRLAELAGPRMARFREFGELTAARHPAEPHQYLAMIAVDPSVQATGIGSRELRRALQRWDLPSYLEASSARSRNLYLRLGFRDIGSPMLLPHDGPTMYPMWRDAG
ncbi:Acetyltransferase (GNAT) family protein [Saccharopolyspora antimicrobica]|uniref:Acetyltransferase (GNAT) family protein n=1 Tax=Saccharopolyspora antimicrobica TaxID=455193 RepID=A0A1I4RQL3_9PSEU|nr:GNAT family N-acetyltransferase [Saccharopolyspora antimicrobica]RKT87915.1 acetyltransferase (GNAT) family protein [Saccharopolyspora antimicrobica]SFM54557.1 Acetyltransferase (GNAT) family protein [Saccharopolyspora antimicrobica]